MVAAETQNTAGILVAEDDPVCQRVLNASLAKWGYDVQTYSDGESSCHALLAEDRPKLAILDWNMPKLAGIDVCRKVRRVANSTEVYILMLTSRTSSEDLARALEAGANDFVRKPFDAKELRARLLVGQRLVSTTPDMRDSPILPNTEATPTAAPRTVPHPLADNGFLTPVFDPMTLKYHYGLPSSMLRAWQDDGTLNKVLIDRVQVCPKCGALPSFRFGCAACGSGCVTNDRLIHHYACAHVAPIDDFEQNDRLVCPKCRVKDLIVGADFEYLTGPYRCLDCNWSAAELEHVAHCLACQYRYPASESVIEDLVAYHSRRNIRGELPQPKTV